MHEGYSYFERSKNKGAGANDLAELPKEWPWMGQIVGESSTAIGRCEFFFLNL